MNRDLSLVALALMIWGIGEGMFLYFEPLYLQQLGADPVMIGTIMGGIGVAMTVAHLPAGYLADRFGRRPLLYASWIMGLLATWIMAYSPTLAWFVVGSALYGFTSFVAVPLNSYITVARGRWSVERALTLVSAAFNLGAIVGPLIGGWIGNTLGLRQTFFVAAWIFVFSTGVILLIRPQPVQHVPPDQRHGSWRAVLTPTYLRFLAIIFITMLCMFLPLPLSQNYLQNVRAVNLAEMGTLISARYFGVVLFNLLLGRLKAHRGFLLAQVAMLLFTVLLWQGTGMPWYVAGYFMAGSFQTARYLGMAIGRTLVSETNMGLGYGLTETACATAAILAPLLAGLLYVRNPTWVYILSAGLISLTLFLTFAFLRPAPIVLPQVSQDYPA